MEKRLKRLLREIIKVVLAEINAKNQTDYQANDVEIVFEHIIPTNEQETVQNAKTEAETKQTEINSIMNVATMIGDDKALEAICAVMEWDYDELQEQLERLNEPQKTAQAKVLLDDVVTDDE